MNKSNRFRHGVSTKLLDADLAALTKVCRKKHRSKGAVIRTAIREYVSRELTKIDNPPDVERRRAA